LLGNQQYECAVFSNGSVFLSDQQYECSVFFYWVGPGVM
jgi:hypothetical protein